MSSFENVQNIIQRVGNGVGFEQGESVLEERFWDLMNRTALKHRHSKPQMEIGPYRVDSIFDCFGKAVVVELDGSGHLLNREYDKQRDEYLCRVVDAVIRIPYKALWNCPDATFAVLTSWYHRFNIRHQAVRLETSRKPLDQLGYTQIYSVSVDYGLVGWAKNWSEGLPVYRIGIRRGKTHPKIVERING